MHLCPLSLSVAPVVAETPSNRRREYQNVPSSGPEVGSGKILPVVPYTSDDNRRAALPNSQSHTNRAPVQSETAVVNIPSTYLQSYQPPKTTPLDNDTSHPRPPVEPLKVPSFAGDIPSPNPNLSASVQPSAISRTYSGHSGPYDPSVKVANESRGRYSLAPDSAISLSGAETSPTPPKPPSKAKGAVKTHSNQNLTVRNASTGGSHPDIPEAMEMQQSSTGSGSGSNDRKGRTKGVSTPKTRRTLIIIDSLVRPTQIQHANPKPRAYLLRSATSTSSTTRQPYRCATPTVCAFRVASISCS